MKSLLPHSIILAVLTLELVTPAFSTPAQAYTIHPVAPNLGVVTRGEAVAARIRYRPSRRRYRFPRWGAPVWSTGGAARGGCQVRKAEAQEEPLVPLMPVTFEAGKEASFFGVTIAERPTFFAYVPQTTAREVEFLLVDEEAGEVIYEKKLPVSGQPQIIRVQLGNEVQPLVIGRNYKWSFTTLCNPKDPVIDSNGNPFIPGLIQRIEPSAVLTSRLGRSSGRDRANLYAEEGIWLDALTTVAQLRCQKPNDRTLLTDWSDLLKAASLEKVPLLSQLVERQRMDAAPISQCAPLQGVK